MTVEWQLYWGGLRVRRDPRCEMFLPGPLPWSRNDPRCGKAATVRVNNLPYWSMKFCPEHAAAFAHRSRVHA